MPELTASLFQYRLPLRFPLAVRGNSTKERAGILLRIAAEDGSVGWGDAAPLPGWSAETLDQAAQDLRRLIAQLPAGRPDAQWVLGSNYPSKEICPSARFAFECAYLGLLSAQASVGLRSILAECPSDRILINALMDGGGEVSQGYSTFKAKVGRGNLEEEAKWVCDLASRLPTGAALRLDANRAWSMEEAERFAALVADLPVEYLEEPLRDPAQLAEFVTQSPIPVAVDETLHERGIGFLEACPGLRAAVLKPALNGGLVDALRIADAAQRHGLYVVVSSGFESGIGIRALAQLAAAIVPPDVACGLDPYRWIEKDVVEPELEIENGAIDLARLDRTVSFVLTENLQELIHD